MKNIAIFLSGSGTNAEKIIEYFEDKNDVQISAIYSNNKNAGAFQKPKILKISSLIFNKDEFYKSEKILTDLKTKNIDLIVLAGFLWLIPMSLIEAFPQRIINIHPALLPKYGGEKMYGINVHKAVSESGDSETGITVHFVNKEFDKGKIISQIRCLIKPHDSPEHIAEKVLKVEHQYYPMIIDQLLENKYYQR